MRRILNFFRWIWLVKIRRKPVAICQNRYCGRPATSWYAFNFRVQKSAHLNTWGQCERCGAVNTMESKVEPDGGKKVILGGNFQKQAARHGRRGW